MRIGVACDEIEPVIVASGKRGLQAVVGRAVDIGKIVDETEVRILRGKGLSASSKVELIQVNDAGKLHAVVADVSGIERKLARKGMLYAYRPVLHIGSTEVAIHGEGVARTWGVTTGVESYAVAAFGDCADNTWRIDCRGLIHPVKARSRNRDTRGDDLSDARTAGWARAGRIKNRSARWNGSHTKGHGILRVLLRHERAHGQKAVHNAAASADHGSSLPRHIPGYAEARREVLVVGLVDGVDVFPHLLESDGGLKIAQQIVGFTGHPLKLIAEPEIQRNFRSDAPVVLRVPGVQPLRHVACRVTGQEGGKCRHAGKKVLEWRRAIG